MDILSKIRSGIESYKKVFPKKYEFITKKINPAEFAVAIAKIESNFNHKAVGKGHEYGLYQFTPGTLYSTIRSYTKNVSASKKLFYKYANSQTFVFMQLVYLNLKNLEARKEMLNPVYEKVLSGLNNNDKILVKLAILHNQGSSAFTRQAKRYNPLVFYVPQFLGALHLLKNNKKQNIASAEAVGYAVWQGIQIAFPELRIAGILSKLALIAATVYVGYKINLKKQLTDIINATNEAYRQQLQERFKIIFLPKDSDAAKQIDEDLKDEDHPLLEPGKGGNKTPKKKPGKKWPKPSAGDVGKVVVAAGAGKALSDAGEGTKNLLDKVGDAAKDIPEKATSLLSSPLFLGAVVGIFYLTSKKR